MGRMTLGPPLTYIHIRICCYLSVRNFEGIVVYLRTLYQLRMLLLGNERKVILCKLEEIKDKAVVSLFGIF
jgi:hypothetical protein